MNACEIHRLAEAAGVRRQHIEGRLIDHQRLQFLEEPRQLSVGDAAAAAPGIDQPAILGVIGEKQRSEMWPRALRVSIADDDELLAAVAFCFAPEPAVAGHVRRIKALRDDSFDIDMAGALEELL